MQGGPSLTLQETQILGLEDRGLRRKGQKPRCRPKPNKADSNQVSGIMGAWQRARHPGHRPEQIPGDPGPLWQHARPASGSEFTRQMVAEPTPDSCCDLALGHPLSCPQSYLSLSRQLTICMGAIMQPGVHLLPGGLSV